MKYNAFAVEFISPKIECYFKPNKPVAKQFFKVYFIYNEKYQIIREIVQLQKDNTYPYCSYRHTDTNMLKTKYYENENIQQFRKMFLDFKDPKTIFTPEYIEINQQQIKSINEFLLTDHKINKTTSKKIISYFGGSNPTGCETNWKANRYIIVNNNEPYNGSNLMNVINKYRSMTKTLFTNINLNIKSINEINVISLQEFFNLNPNFKEIYDNVNQQWILLKNELDTQFTDYNETNNESIDTNEKIIKNPSNKYHFSNLDEYYCFLENLLFSKHININNLSKEKLAKLLRKYFNYSCDLSKVFKIYHGHIFSVQNDKGASPDRAHIIGINKTLVKSIINEKSWIKKNKIFLFGIKHLNCLNITPNLHRNYDNNILTIDPISGYFIDSQNRITKLKLHEDELKDKKRYIEYTYNNFIKNKFNL